LLTGHFEPGPILGDTVQEQQRSNVVAVDFRRHLATPPPPPAVVQISALYALPLLFGMAAGAAACYLAADLCDPRRAP
jgi:hypothetical protein